MNTDQTKIWAHFQNDGVDAFTGNTARLEFLCRQLRAGQRVLNIGVGNAAFERMALAKGVDVWALDPDERTVERVRATLCLGSKAQVGFSQAIPFPAEHFDVVVMSEVLEHLDDDTLQGSLLDVHRVLRVGGRFMGTVPARENLANSHVVCPGCGHHFHRWGHQRSFDATTLNRVLETVFHPETVRELFFVEWAHASCWRRLQGLIKRLLSWRNIGPYGAARNLYFSAVKNAASAAR